MSASLLPPAADIFGRSTRLGLDVEADFTRHCPRRRIIHRNANTSRVTPDTPQWTDHLVWTG
jgi:hypothetical protein